MGAEAYLEGVAPAANTKLFVVGEATDWDGVCFVVRCVQCELALDLRGC